MLLTPSVAAHWLLPWLVLLVACTGHLCAGPGLAAWLRTQWQISTQETQSTQEGWLKVFSIRSGVVGIRGLRSGLFLCMTKEGVLWASEKFTTDCLFREELQENLYTTYTSASHPGLYLALSRRGKAKRGNSVRKEQRYTHFLPRLCESADLTMKTVSEHTKTCGCGLGQKPVDTTTAFSHKEVGQTPDSQVDRGMIVQRKQNRVSTVHPVSATETSASIAAVQEPAAKNVFSESTQIELVSVTEEELPTVEAPPPTADSLYPDLTPFAEVSTEAINSSQGPLSQTPTTPGTAMPVTKVQPFVNEDELPEKTLRGRLLAHRLELLIGACLLLALILAIGIGLGVGLSCMGKFRCGSSSRCISSSAQCDGTVDCEHGEDELLCVRLAGKSSVLQVLSAGVWKTVCSEDWSPTLSLFTCRQLGYPRYVASSSLPLDSIEEEFQTHLVSIKPSQQNLMQPMKIHNATVDSKNYCSSGAVTSLKCLNCGARPLFSSRIVGGNLSVEGQFPWQVSLHFQREHLCGGSIIAPQWVVTAAHCVHGFAYPSLWAVVVGRTEQPVNGAQYQSVDKIFYHSRYRPKALDYDIALMKLSQELVFSGEVEPICLPNYGEQFEDGKMCWISGWGATVDGGEASIALHSARVPLMSSRTCSQPGVYQGFISPWMICAGYLEGGIDSCQGDSGGPLACEDSVWKLVGVTSWGQGCAEKNKPGVYTRVSQALSWIREHMEREEYLNSGTVSSDH